MQTAPGARVSRFVFSLTRSLNRLTRAWLPIALLVPTGCYLNVKGSSDQAVKLATATHQQMAQSDLAGIYNNADQRYRNAVTREKSDALFSSISRKLGAPLDCKPGSTNTQVATWGSTIVSECTTRFSKDATGVETFTWSKTGENYRLLGYHINSTDLIER
jgi:hypothetical protein